jgi:hypothetical protein
MTARGSSQPHSSRGGVTSSLFAAWTAVLEELLSMLLSTCLPAPRLVNAVMWYTCSHQVDSPSLMHLPLTFEGLMCLLSLRGRQEHCPFTTRLRVLKLMGRQQG